MFLAGFATFSLIYCVQPLLPEFAAHFGISAGESSLAMSLTTASLAMSILLMAAFSEKVGRRGLIFFSMVLASVFAIAAAIAPSWEGILLARTLQGVALGGVPAVAMAYLAEEVSPERLGLSMGLYVGGTAFGGMAGRVVTGALAEWLTWKGALAIIGLIDLMTAFLFLLLLPASTNFVARKGLSLQTHLRAWSDHLRDPFLFLLFSIGFVSLGAFMAIYNFIGFRLINEPYNLNSAQIGLIFLAYIGGIAASASAGALANRIGRGTIMLAGTIICLTGVGLTTLTPLYAIIAGIVTVTIGFFMVHSVASAWVGKRAPRNKGHASSLYLLSYYLGASVLGSSGGLAWRGGGWDAVALYAAGLLSGLLLLTILLRRAEDGSWQSQT
ncbi:MFS transporter (plasmid) [Rhizobium sp. ACO-34A]|nr:MFS transporter [Rhizobium sp. ACO-34A]ATN36856.1 MFS transporter [Rhizobium sp. ACO-34A]